MGTFAASKLADLLLAQFAAESYLDAANVTLADRLRFGNNNPNQATAGDANSANLRGKTRMTEAQIVRFLQTYDIVAHQPNTWSGFSGTLLRNRITNEYVLSFRSTEYADERDGGDWPRDGLGADK